MGKNVVREKMFRSCVSRRFSVAMRHDVMYVSFRSSYLLTVHRDRIESDREKCHARIKNYSEAGMFLVLCISEIFRCVVMRMRRDLLSRDVFELYLCMYRPSPIY